jgi:hypothetical protein
MTFANQIQLRISSVFNRKGLHGAIVAAKRLKKEQAELNRFSQTFARQMGLTEKQTVQAFKRGKAAARQFRSEFLSIMFFGMAMERAFGGLLRSAHATFKQMTEGTDKANNAMTHLSAAWEFFKFSLFEALLRSPVFQRMIDWAMALIDWFAGLSDEGQQLVANILLIGAAIGTALAGAGIIVMGIQGVSTMLASAGIAASQVTTALAGIGFITLTLMSGREALRAWDEGEFGTALFNAIKTAVQGFAAYRVIRGGSAGPAIVLGIALELVGMEQTRSWLAKLLGLIAGAIAWSVSHIGSLIERAFAHIELSVLNIIDGIISLISRIPGMGGLANQLSSHSRMLRRSAQDRADGRGLFNAASFNEFTKVSTDAAQSILDFFSLDWMDGMFKEVQSQQLPAHQVSSGPISPAQPTQSFNIEQLNMTVDSREDMEWWQEQMQMQASRAGLASYS